MSADYQLIQTSPKNFNPAKSLFCADWAHFHPGWLRPDDYASESRCFRIEDSERSDQELFSFGITDIDSREGWLEFAAVHNPFINASRFASYIREAARVSELRRLFFLPTENNPLVTELIAGLNFRVTDRIVTLSAFLSEPVIPAPLSKGFTVEYDMDLSDSPLIDSLYQIDQSFPSIWRLSKLSFQLALKGANIRRFVREAGSGNPIAYLIATEEENTIHISRVAVIPNLRDRGIGTNLIRNLIADSASIKSFTVNTYTKNVPALRMYEKLGFAIESEFWTLYQTVV